MEALTEKLSRKEALRIERENDGEDLSKENRL
jgi:hypothetical protein